MSNSTLSEQEITTFNEWAFNLWTNSRDWCEQCDKEKNKLVFDDQTKTTRCTQCNHVIEYGDRDWKVLQANRYVTYRYMPGKYFFNNLSTEEIFRKYLRELNHNDWLSWLIHDYVLAKIKTDNPTQDKLTEAAKLIVNKMHYDPEPWKTLFEKMDAPDPEMFYQIPQIIYEQVQKKFIETAPKEELTAIFQSYVSTLNSVYDYNRWKGDYVTCWIASEIIKLCDIESFLIEFYTKCFECDPVLENLPKDLLTGKHPKFNFKDTYIQWELRLADNYLAESKALAATRAAYNALTAKLGIHTIWPPTKTIDFDINTVKKVTQLINDPELYRLYDIATSLNSIDAPKACWYAKHFIQKIKELLPKVTSIEQEVEKSTAYIT
ncbi:MAG: hypothetical protein LBH74_06275 [Nitrososphaerota archaeon]|nr:hypothetical protein [Nitrososphaerota archaeon]